MSKAMEIRKAVKATIIKRGGVNKLLNRDYTEIREALGCSYCDIQNAHNYFQYSPQQEKFRASFNA